MGTKCIITACFGADSGAGVAQAWIVDAPGAMRHWSDQSLRKREKEHSTLAAREDAVAGGPEEELGEARELFAGGEGGGAGEGSGGDGGGAGGDGAAAGGGLQLPGGLGLVIKPVALPSPRTTAADWLLTSPRCVSPHCFCHSFPLTFPPFFLSLLRPLSSPIICQCSLVAFPADFSVGCLQRGPGFAVRAPLAEHNGAGVWFPLFLFAVRKQLKKNDAFR